MHHMREQKTVDKWLEQWGCFISKNLNIILASYFA